MKFEFLLNNVSKQAVCALFAAAALTFSACSSDPGPEPVDPEGEYQVLSGDISTRTLTANNKYLLSGQVFVRSGQVLTIEPGTIIAGERSSRGTLIVDRGGQIMAAGTATAPIIFTSNQAVGDRDRGDWGGIVLLGRAPVNLENPSVEGITPAVQYGGTSAEDNSGVMSYVRVEFAGIELTPNNETNGITLGGVGRGTQFNHIQVSYGGDDGIEWFGGNVNGDHLIVFGTWDDCFDIDNGFSGNLQFGLSIRYPSYADQSESNGFEWDTDGDNNLSRFKTTAVASNFTMIGPAIRTNEVNNSISGNYRYAVDLRRNVAGSIFNSVFVGYPNAIRMNQSSVFPNYVNASVDNADRGVIANNIFYARTAGVVSGSEATASVASITAYLTTNGNTVEAGNNFQTPQAYQALGINPDLFFGTGLRILTQYPSTQNFAVTTGTLATGANFNYPKFREANRANRFNTNVAYRGAFGATDWTQGWTEFNPVMRAY
ncbi:hypothetical protein PQ465_05130 [Sphingobacterium oryzagri]|uniref:T9SS C-terminal target domain-containing protein n=1 Tax=Sphingobacterium oryzagri TaxID=3025669 RepID=A0ABY7WR33_9SPHI|nr:hypothetical protein [Sphingobacterium sp. KACC 22765]WDF69764.1 hypothetical protein PQ465_05130 [Sphingobacterium sp. KACC 22765]